MIPTFQPLVDAARGVDLSDPVAARAELARRLDPAGSAAAQLNRALVALLDERRIADRGEPPVRWSRVAKSGPETASFSIDAVEMNGPGPHHVHPAGEVNWCVPLEGDPRFEGTRAGWVVMPPGSGHVPAVSGGRMLIVYLLPEGRIEFTKPAGR
jgi:hypothetical protein